MKTENITLLPCPECSKKGKVCGKNWSKYVWCEECGMATEYCDNYEEAIRIWNVGRSAFPKGFERAFTKYQWAEIGKGFQRMMRESGRKPIVEF